jgi:hypothetical protein
MSLAEERGEANEGAEQQSVEISEWIHRLEAQPEWLRLLELKALLEKLDPDGEWVRQLKGRIDGVLEPKVLDSDAASHLRRLTHRRRRFDTTKPTELCFGVLLTEDDVRPVRWTRA